MLVGRPCWFSPTRSDPAGFESCAPQSDRFPRKPRRPAEEACLFSLAAVGPENQTAGIPHSGARVLNFLRLSEQRRTTTMASASMWAGCQETRTSLVNGSVVNVCYDSRSSYSRQMRWPGRFGPHVSILHINVHRSACRVVVQKDVCVIYENSVYVRSQRLTQRV